MWALNAGNAVNLCQLCRMASRHLHGLPGAAEYGLECCHAKHMWGICYAHLAGPGFAGKLCRPSALSALQPHTGASGCSKRVL